MTDTTASSPLSGNVLLYSKPEPLSFELHGALGADPVENPYGFVAETNLVPLMVTEFGGISLVPGGHGGHGEPGKDGQPGEDGVVAGDRLDVPLLEGDEAAGVVGGPDRDDLGGTPDEVVRDPKVIEIYLGGEFELA